MTRNEVHDLVIKHMRLNIDDLEGVEIDSKKSMATYGASSIDMVEVVSAVMRTLKIRVPRTQLITLKSIDQLVELLSTYTEENDGETITEESVSKGKL